MTSSNHPGMKGVHWMPPSKEAADLVFDTVDDEITALKARIKELNEYADAADDLHRHQEDALRIKVDEYRMDAREWRSIAQDLFLGCVCQVADVEEGHTCNYQKARAAVLFWWRREAEKRG